ncbi:unnamed protein product, partial [Effrenium voratum]
AWFVIWMISSIVYLPASIPSFFSFRMKLRNHQLLLDQMADFDVRKAKCTVPSDRNAIEQQVKELFKEDHRPMSWLPPEGVDEGEVSVNNRLSQLWLDPLDSFNAYVRGALRENVIRQIGKELYVPWQTCLTAFLPMILYSVVNVLGCDNGPCEVSARLAGYSSASQYMIVQSIGWVLCIALAFPLTYPTLLQMLTCALSSGCPAPVQLVLAFLCCPAAYVYCYICGGLIWASLISLVEDYSVGQLLVFMSVMALLVAQAVSLPRLCGFLSGTRISRTCRVDVSGDRPTKKSTPDFSLIVPKRAPKGDTPIGHTDPSDRTIFWAARQCLARTKERGCLSRSTWLKRGLSMFPCGA